MMIWMDDGTLRFEAVELLRANTPTPSGRVYSTDVIRRMFREALEAKPLLVTMDAKYNYDPGVIKLADAVGIIESVTISEDGVVTGKGRMLDTHKGRTVIDHLRALAGIGGGPYRSRPTKIEMGMSVMAMGTVDEDGTVRDARLTGVELIEQK